MPNTIQTIDSSILEYFMWDLGGTGATAASSPGILKGGSISGTFKNIRDEGVADVEAEIADLNEYMASAKLSMTVDTVPLYRNSLRTSGGLPLLRLHGGTSQLGWTHLNAVIDKAKLSVKSGATNQPIALDLDFIALSGTPGTGNVSQAAITALPFIPAKTVVTINAADFLLVEGDFEIANNFKAEQHCGTKAAGSERDPTHFVPGRVQHTVKTKLRKILPASPVVTAPAANAMVVTMTDNATIPNVLVLTYAGLAFDGGWNVPFVPSGAVDFEFGFAGAYGALTVTLNGS